MQTLSFSVIEGRHPVYSKYAYRSFGGVTFLGPAEDARPTVYDPLKNSDILLLYVMAVADVILSCAEFWEYCAKRSGGRISDYIFFSGDDFLSGNSADARRIKHILLSFAGKYGLPEWSPGSLDITVPDRYASLPPGADDSAPSPEALSVISEHAAAAGRDFIPAGAMALIMAELYERYLTRGGEFRSLRRAELTFSRAPGKKPDFGITARGLTACTDMAYISIVSGGRGELRKCKRCGKFFIAADVRAKYCSKRCRGAYNSAMTRKRLREDGDA